MSKTVSALFKEAAAELKQVSGEAAGFEAAQLIEKHFHLNRAELVIKGEISASDEKEADFSSDLHERMKGRPLQYILGRWEFYSLPFFVGEGVLIPRPDTELLVEEALGIIKQKPAAIIADLCSGSGCIAVSVAKNSENASVFAFEKYDKAFDYLERNIRLNSTGNVTAVKADIFVAEPQKEYFDLILSNPPYIPEQDIRHLSCEVRNEPVEALAAGEDGLIFYRKIAERWLIALKVGGNMVLEVGNEQSEQVRKIFIPYFKTVVSKKDLNGIERVIIGTHKL